MTHREAPSPAMQLNALLQMQELLFVIGLIAILLAIERILLHRRLMVELKHQARTSEEIDFDQPKFPYASIGLLLVAIGLGFVASQNTGLGGPVELIILLTGIFYFAWWGVLDPFISDHFKENANLRAVRTVLVMKEIESNEDDGDNR